MTAPAAPVRSSRTLVGALGASILLVAWVTADSSRIDSFPYLALVVIVWTGALLWTIARHPLRELRLSDPAVILLLWAAYYFILPATSWLRGEQLFLEGIRTIEVTAPLMQKVQILHCVFLVALIGAYQALRPRLAFRALRADEIARLPRVRWLVCVGLLPTLIEVVTRLATSGTIAPEMTYGEVWEQARSSIDASRAAGGAGYVVTQILSKVGFFSTMTLGMALGLLVVRYWNARRWWLLLGLHALAPVILYLSGGARSSAIYPFVIALIMADFLAGPVPWRYILTVAILGFSFFSFYAFFRAHQSEGLANAIAATVEDLGDQQELDIAEAENSVMLVKEAYAVDMVGQRGTTGLGRYIGDLLVAPIPSQLLGDKPMYPAEVLSREMLGDRLVDEGVGVAGSVIAELYLAAGEWGILLMATFLGAMTAVMLRKIARASDSNSRTPIWKMGIVAAFASQLTLYIRGDLAMVVVYVAFYVLVPIIVLGAILRRTPSSPWNLVLEAVSATERPSPSVVELSAKAPTPLHLVSHSALKTGGAERAGS